jgi:hypothetical protein
MKGINFFPFLVLVGCASFSLSLAFPFCLLCDGSTIDLLLEFFFSLRIDVKQDVEIEGWKSIILTHMYRVMLEE